MVVGRRSVEAVDEAGAVVGGAIGAASAWAGGDDGRAIRSVPTPSSSTPATAQTTPGTRPPVPTALGARHRHVPRERPPSGQPPRWQRPVDGRWAAWWAARRRPGRRGAAASGAPSPPSCVGATSDDRGSAPCPRPTPGGRPGPTRARPRRPLASSLPGRHRTHRAPAGRGARAARGRGRCGRGRCHRRGGRRAWRRRPRSDRRRGRPGAARRRPRHGRRGRAAAPSRPRCPTTRAPRPRPGAPPPAAARPRPAARGPQHPLPA